MLSAKTPLPLAWQNNNNFFTTLISSLSSREKTINNLKNGNCFFADSMNSLYGTLQQAKQHILDIPVLLLYHKTNVPHTHRDKHDFYRDCCLFLISIKSTAFIEDLRVYESYLYLLERLFWVDDTLLVLGIVNN